LEPLRCSREGAAGYEAGRSQSDAAKLLAERFKLVVHKDPKPMPAYALMVGKDNKPNMKQTSGGGQPDCQPVQNPAPGAPPDQSLTWLCTTEEKRALIERPYRRGPQAVGAVYDRARSVVQSPSHATT
jgi:uncharacterized protein (TIGR03435 family)